MQERIISEAPIQVMVQTDRGWTVMEHPSGACWTGEDATLTLERSSFGHAVTVRIRIGSIPCRRFSLRWHAAWHPGTRFLGDQWERGYGDLMWRGLIPEQVMPWYFLAADGDGTRGVGVMTGPDAMCLWRTDAEGCTLVLDVRCGGCGVEASGQAMDAAVLVERTGNSTESPFDAACAFCAMLCRDSLTVDTPVYGGNNWYYAYGNSEADRLVEDAARIASWAEGCSHRPYMVVDAGWQEIFVRGASCSGGPWHRGNARFTDMEGLAARMREKGAVPGLWCRPLLTVENLPEAWLLGRDRFPSPYEGDVLDPTVPEACAHIRADVARMAGWGYGLIKHDFSTFDLTGRWGFDMGSALTQDGWSFRDRTVTTAQAIKRLYRAILEGAASQGALVMGCNTVGHLAAGLVHVQRTGDDTSGREWERTRKMGVNTLAFRMPQHRSFFLADADCVGLTPDVPWERNRQWMDLLARSGTPLFLSADPAAIGPEQEQQIRIAFRDACAARGAAQPMDWMDTSCPSVWRFSDGENAARYGWSDPLSPC